MVYCVPDLPLFITPSPIIPPNIAITMGDPEINGNTVLYLNIRYLCGRETKVTLVYLVTPLFYSSIPLHSSWINLASSGKYSGSISTNEEKS